MMRLELSSRYATFVLVENVLSYLKTRKTTDAAQSDRRNCTLPGLEKICDAVRAEFFCKLTLLAIELTPFQRFKYVT